MSSLTIIAIISIVFGLYFGLGMPATMGFHAAVTKIEERAKFGGVAFLIIGVISSIAGLVIFDSLFASCLLLALVRFLGLGVFFLQRKEVAYQEKDESKVLNYQNILSNKSVIFYFIPWFMITLINYMIFPIQQPIFEHEKLDYNTLMAVEYIITAVFAVLSGFIADKLGRKRLAIIGFIMLGIGYAVIGIFPISYLKFSSILYVFADGIAWGIFYVLFIFTLWGDIAQGKHADKIYFLGALPYVFSFFIQELFTPVLTKYFDAIKNPTIIFSFASIFLFLAVLPLIYAPETLPEKTLKDRELVTYIEKAQKIVKKQRKSSSREEIQKTSKQTNSEDYEKARALAENTIKHPCNLRISYVLPCDTHQRLQSSV